MTLDEVLEPLLHPTCVRCRTAASATGNVLPPKEKPKERRAVSEDEMEKYREEESMAGTEDE